MSRGWAISPDNLNAKSSYEIKIFGELDRQWSDWFDGAEVTTDFTDKRYPRTSLICSRIDQAKLRGILNKIWDMNAYVISVIQISDPNFGGEAPESIFDCNVRPESHDGG